MRGHRRRSPTASPSPATRSPRRSRCANLDVFEREDLCGHVLAKEGEFRGDARGLRDIPIVGDVRGAGYFHAIELVKDQETKESFNDEESECAAARLPLRRALPPRADLPRRRSRRPRDPARAAADLPTPSSSRRSTTSCGRCSTRPGTDGEPTSAPPGRSAHRCSPSKPRSTSSTSSSPPARHGADAPVRWVHISELEDPTPWLSGGELLLTTGHPARHAAKQRAFVALLADHGLAGLGFGTGFDHEKLPEGAGRRGRGARLPAVRGPVRDAVHRDHRERLRRGSSTSSTRCCSAAIAVQRAARAAGARGARARGDRRARSPRAVGGTACVLDGRGERAPRAASAASSPPRRSPRSATRCAAAPATAQPPSCPRTRLARRRGRSPSRCRSAAGGGRAAGLAGDRPRLRRARRLRAADRCTRRSTVVALELMRAPRRPRDRAAARRRRARRRRSAASSTAPSCARRLEPFGIGGEAAVLVFDARRPRPPPRRRSSDALRGEAVPALVAPARRRRPARCSARSSTPATATRSSVAARRPRGARRQTRRGRGAARQPRRRRRSAAPRLPRGALRARGDARSTRRATARPGGRLLPRPRRLHPAALDPGRRRAAPLLRQRCSARSRTGEGEYGGELLRSLEAFIEHNGQWERAARELYCHRHTLRYRIRKVEELTGRDLVARPRPDRVLAGAAREGAGEMTARTDHDDERRAMKVGVPTEIKADEYRVAITAGRACAS